MKSKLTSRFLKISITTLILISVTEISFNKEYTVEFPTKAGHLSLVIYLGPKFPFEKPTMKICPRIIHKWVDTTGEIVLAPGLMNVRMLHQLTHSYFNL